MLMFFCLKLYILGNMYSIFQQSYEIILIHESDLVGQGQKFVSLKSFFG